MGLAVDELQISMSAGLGEYGGTHTGGNLAVDVVSGKTGSAKVVKEKNKDNDQMRETFFYCTVYKKFEDMEKKHRANLNRIIVGGRLTRRKKTI